MIIECEFSPLELDAIQTALEQATEKPNQKWFGVILESVRHQRFYGRIKKEEPPTAVVRGAELSAGSAAIIHT